MYDGIEAVSGEKALDRINEMGDLLDSAANALKTNPDKLLDKLQQLVDKNKTADKEIRKLKDQLTG